MKLFEIQCYYEKKKKSKKESLKCKIEREQIMGQVKTHCRDGGGERW